MSDTDALFRAVSEVHRCVVGGQPLPVTLQHMAAVARSAFAGEAGVGITVLQEEDPVTAAGSGPDVMALDTVQYDYGDGPCLHSYRTTHTVLLDPIADDDRWPHFAQAAAEHQVPTSFSVPLLVAERGIGALNFYGSAVGTFDEPAQEVATALGEQIAIAVSHSLLRAEESRLVTQLQTAVESRDVIGQAKGIIMARNNVTAEEAFELLRQASQNRNLKLRAVAEQVAETGWLEED